MTNTKSLITDWVYDGTYVIGNEPSSGKGIRTSIVKRMWVDTEGKLICETQNSLYELQVVSASDR